MNVGSGTLSRSTNLRGRLGQHPMVAALATRDADPMEHEQTTTESGNAESRQSKTSAMWDRPVEGRMIGGVAVGIAERMRVAPWLVRTLFAIASIGQGAGVLLYFVLWLLMPDRSSGRSVIDDAGFDIGPINSPARVAGVISIVLGVAVLLAATSFLSKPLLAAIVLAGAGVALIGSRN